MKYSYCVAIALIAFGFNLVIAQDIDCFEEIFRASRFPDDCSRFFLCLIGNRINFTCDPGQIFDEDRIECRFGSSDTCQFHAVPIPEDECVNDFLRQEPHPDPDLCMLFFVCMNHNLVVFDCGAGMIYSRTTERCVPGNHDTCQEDDLTPYNKLMTSFGKKLV